VHHANSSLLFHSLDPVPEELELEAQVEKAEEANPEPEQGKPGPSQPILEFYVELISLC
jgi:hypothetical protein